MQNPPMLELEKSLLNEGFELVHDGQQNPGCFKADEVRCFTRKYRGKSGMILTVKHDIRKGVGDIVRIEHCRGNSKEGFVLGRRSHKNAREFFDLEEGH